MGKTRLALTLGRTRQPNFADGVFLVSLAPLANAATIVPTIAATLGISVHGGDPRQAVLHALSDKRLLLILDNFEHLLDGVDIVVDILEAAPSVAIIATSRERLNVRGEHYYSLQGLTFEPTKALADAANMEAVRLFVQSAQRVQPDFELSAANISDVLRICQLVQGMPLGLELAAAWTETLPVKVIAAEVERSADFLAAEWRDAPQRHRSLRAVFDWSWQLLDDNERQVYKQLSIFRGGFTSEAALAVAGASFRVLLNLQRKSLLRRSEAPGTWGWYDIHEVLRQFAAEVLGAGAGELASIAARHSSFYLALAEEAATKYYSHDQVIWLDHIEREYDNIRAALAWLEQQSDLEAALRLAGALRYFWFVRGYHTEGSEQLLRILARSAVYGPGAAQVQALNAAGYLQWVRGKEHEAGRLLEEALRHSRAIDNQPGTAFALCYLGTVTNAHGEYAKATGFLEESLAIWRKLHNENDIGLALMFLGDSMIGIGNHERARALFSESARILKRLGNTSVLPYPLRRLGYEAHRVGERAEAVRLYAESMTLNLEVRDRQGVAASLVGLATIAGDSGMWNEAARLLGATESILASIQTQLLPFDGQQNDRLLNRIYARSDKTAFGVAWQEGRAQTIEQAVQAAGELITLLSKSTFVGA
jgi:predicted ATPase